jgi:hypothetical protein
VFVNVRHFHPSLIFAGKDRKSRGRQPLSI